MLRGLAVLGGAVTLLIFYYWVHKPLTPAFGWVLRWVSLDLRAGGLVVVAGGSLGRRLNPVDVPHTSERVALEGSIGLGVLAWLVLGLGLTGFVQPLILWLLLVIVLAITTPAAFIWSRDVLHVIGRGLRQVRTRWERFLLGLLFFWLVTALLAALAPPFAWDALMYHLVGPQRALASGTFSGYTDNHYLGFPQGVESLFTLAVGLFDRATAAAPLHFAFGILGLMGMLGLVRRFADVATALLAAALLLGGYSMWLLFTWPYVDLAVFAYSVGALIALIHWQANPNWRWLVVVGACAGLAIGVKYTAGLILLGAGVVILVNSTQRIRDVVLLGGMTGLFYVPWALRGVLLYANPVYPFVFGGLGWDEARASAFATGGGLLMSEDAWQLAILPFAATVFGVEKGPVYSFAVGPWLFVAPLSLLLGWRFLPSTARPMAKVAAWAGLPMLIAWVVLGAFTGLGAQTRLMMPLLPIAAILGALGFFSLGRWPVRPVNIGFVIHALLVMTLIFSTIEVTGSVVRDGVARVLLSTQSGQAYLQTNLGTYAIAMQQLGALPDEARVLLLWEPRAYYCPVDCTPDPISGDLWTRALRVQDDPRAVFASWHDEGYTHVLLSEAGLRFSITEIGASGPFYAEIVRWPTSSSFLVPIWDDGVGGYTLYELVTGS